jgi:hypothetical protein
MGSHSTSVHFSDFGRKSIMYSFTKLQPEKIATYTADALINMRFSVVNEKTVQSAIFYFV